MVSSHITRYDYLLSTITNYISRTLAPTKENVSVELSAFSISFQKSKSLQFFSSKI